jgi:hypothetical protein
LVLASFAFKDLFLGRYGMNKGGRKHTTISLLAMLLHSPISERERDGLLMWHSRKWGSIWVGNRAYNMVLEAHNYCELALISFTTPPS